MKSMSPKYQLLMKFPKKKAHGVKVHLQLSSSIEHQLINVQFFAQQGPSNYLQLNLWCETNFHF